VILAVIFGGSFVVFGVGSEVPGGIADVLGRSPGSTGLPSLSEARENVEKNPNDPAALRELATALQAEGRTEEAIATLVKLQNVAPRDEAALRELASLYLAQAAGYRQELQRARAEAAFLAPDEAFLPDRGTDIGRALADRPITGALTERADERFYKALGELQSTYAKAKETYTALAAVATDDPTVQLQLADAALNAGDDATALTAYKRFVELAPDDPSAPLVKQEITRLEKGASGGTG
jgi:tetratricopeptide (TPR) repeat protein